MTRTQWKAKVWEIQPLRIHCWGGLGSQLLAVALLVDMEERFPSRKINLVLHQGGVTLRKSEIDVLFTGINTEHVLDFGHEFIGKNNLSSRSLAEPFRLIAKRLLSKLGVVIFLSDDLDFSRVHRFTMSIRGHYSYRSISSITVKKMLERLTVTARNSFLNNFEPQIGLGVHYRLGDLLVLETKKPLSEIRIIEIVKKILNSNSLGKLTVFSDSPTVAKSRLEEKLNGVLIENPESQTWDAICHLVNSEFFVGTFSKVSLWVSIFRYHSPNEKISFMPVESRSNIQDFLGKNLDERKLIFY